MRIVLLAALAGCGGESHRGQPIPEPIDPIVYVPESCEYEVTLPGDFGPIDPSEETYGLRPVPTGIHLTFPDDPRTTVAFAWTTGRPDGEEPADTETLASSVEIGRSADALDRRVKGWSLVATNRGGETARRLHEAHVCGLEPATTYWYRVGGDDAWSDIRSFQTSPADGDTGLVRFAVVGDSRGRLGDDDWVWRDVAEAVDAFDPAFVVHTGDATTYGYELEEWEWFFDEASDLFAHAPLLFARGNHEEDYPTPDTPKPIQSLELALPGNERWYETRFGNLDFIVLADWPPRHHRGDGWEPDDIGGVERDFLEDALCSTDAGWRFAVHHRPPFDTGQQYAGDQEDLVDTWVPVFDECELELDLAGHDHVYGRTFAIRDGEVAARHRKGTTYAIVAGGGAPLYEVAEPRDWFTAVAERTFHFAIVEVEGNTLHWRAFRVDPDDPDVDGTLLDEFTLTK